MLSFAGAAVLVVGFLVFVRLFHLVRHSKSVLALGRESSRVLLDSQLSDLEKERFLKATTFRLLKAFLIILGGSLAALLLPALLLWQLDQWGVLPYQASMDLTLSWEFILAISVISFAAYFGWRKWGDNAPSEQQTETSFENSYSGNDQRLHQLAFASRSLQVSLNGFEDKCFARRLAQIDIDRPVFVTGLPRSGTTLLLELLVDSGEFVSHTYRDMPFLMLPLLWQRFSRLFKQDLEARERAHGDGMMVTLDSPEAFEEIIWRHFWPKHYQQGRIVPWQKSQSAFFEAFLKNHFRKIIAARTASHVNCQRYISKNNLNIARLPYLQRIFPQATILVPFRHPLQHASSLLRQHRNFLAIHAEDHFASDYMRDIGHYDFGENLKPVDFDGWVSSAGELQASSINFWLQYWINSYRYIDNLDAAQIQLLNYDGLCIDPENGLAKVAQFVGLGEPSTLTAMSGRLSPPRPYSAPDDIDTELLAQAELLYQRLVSRS